MQIKILLAGLLLTGLSPLAVQAQPCQKVNSSQSPAYILREQDKRCEGILAPDASGDFSLVSLAIGQVKPTNPLRLRVPDRANQQRPKIRVRSAQKNYQLDPLEFPYRNGQFQVQWSDYVLRTESIPLSSLRATASVRVGSQRVYIPVILSSGAGSYSIVLSSDRRARIPVFQIQRNGKVIYSSPRNTFQPRGQIRFSWNGRDQNGRTAAAGRYELRVKAELEQDNAPPNPASVDIAFEHNPEWLK